MKTQVEEYKKRAKKLQLVTDIMHEVFMGTESWEQLDDDDYESREMGTNLAYLVYGILSRAGYESKPDSQVMRIIREHPELYAQLGEFVDFVDENGDIIETE